MNVRVVCLVSGQEVIAQIKDAVGEVAPNYVGQKDVVYLVHPMMIVPVPSQGGMATVPFGTMFGKSQDEIPIKRDHILFTEEPNDEILELYKNFVERKQIAGKHPGIAIAHSMQDVENQKRSFDRLLKG